MGSSRVALATLLLALPVGIEIPATGDSTGHAPGSTRLEVSGGAGYYALIARDCEGVPYDHLPMRYREAGASITHHLAGPLHVGLRGGIVRDEVGVGSRTVPRGLFSGDLELGTRDNSYLNPNASLEWTNFGIGGGGVVSRLDFPITGPDAVHIDWSGHLRIGPEGHYFSIAFMENVPLYSGGGYADFGFGFRPCASLDGWAGLSGGGPFDGTGAALKADWWVTRRTSVDLRTRLGYTASQYQNGVSVGLSYVAGRR